MVEDTSTYSLYSLLDHNHYRREHLTRVNFTNTVLDPSTATVSMAPADCIDVSDEEFFDADSEL